MNSGWDFILLLMDVFSAVGLEVQIKFLLVQAQVGLGKGYGSCLHILLDGGEPIGCCSFRACPPGL